SRRVMRSRSNVPFRLLCLTFGRLSSAPTWNLAAIVCHREIYGKHGGRATERFGDSDHVLATLDHMAVHRDAIPGEAARACYQMLRRETHQEVPMLVGNLTVDLA